MTNSFQLEQGARWQSLSICEPTTIPQTRSNGCETKLRLLKISHRCAFYARPHLTFAIYDSPQIEETIAWRAMLCATERETRLTLAFRRIRWFVGPPLILWAEPEANETSEHGTLQSARPSTRLIAGHIIDLALGRRIAHSAQFPMNEAKTPSLLHSHSTVASKYFRRGGLRHFPPMRIVAQQELPKDAP